MYRRMLSRLKSSVFLPTVGSVYSKSVRTPAPTEMGGSEMSSARARDSGAARRTAPAHAAARPLQGCRGLGTKHEVGANRAPTGPKWCDLIVWLLPTGLTPVCLYARRAPPPAVR